MAASESSIRAQVGSGVGGSVWIEPLLGLGLGAVGGALQSVLLTTSPTHPAKRLSSGRPSPSGICP